MFVFRIFQFNQNPILVNTDHSAGLHGPGVSFEILRPTVRGCRKMNIGELGNSMADFFIDVAGNFAALRVGEGDNMEEYRRVVSYYGGTTNFKNGSPCSAHTYVQGTTR